MPNKMLIDATHPEETRVVVVRGNRVEEFDFESAQRKQLRGNIYLAKVTRVEPSLQAAFVEYGGNRHGFLAFSEIHPDYYQIPVADRQALIEDEERAQREAEEESENRQHRRRRHRSSRRRGGDRVRSRAIEHADEAHSLSAAGDDPVARAHIEHGYYRYQPPKELEEPGADVATTAEPVQAIETDASDIPSAHETSIDAVSDPATASGQVLPSEAELPEAGTAPESEGSEPVAPAAIGVDADSSDHTDAQDDDDEDDDEETTEDEQVESVGGDDAMEEVPERPFRPRRQYKIQEVIKRRQVMLIQVVKEERGNKGAALTTYLSLAGRYAVLMPNTARGGGISRKITSAQDRNRLKEVVQDLDVPEGMGVILRTAGAARTQPEIKRDFEYLLRAWEQVRDLTLKSTAPTLVYEEGSLIKRSIRDLFNKEIDEVIVAGDTGYHEARDFMKMLMPNATRAVKPYREGQPLFSRMGVESQLDAMFSPTVQLRSGGYIVINQTEALVSIDVNSGRSTREHHIEDTALKTNLEAAEEVARQLRLRDLAGLIVIDFIDMDEKRNNRAVERKLSDCLRHDRARIQVGRISHFGLLEMSRQRIRASVLESSTEPCPHCGGTGHVRSVSSVALQLLRSVEEILMKGATHNLVVRTRTEVALYVLNHKRGHLRDLENAFKVTISVIADATQQSFVIDHGDQVHTLEAAKALLATQAATTKQPIAEAEDEDDDFIDDEAEGVDSDEAADAQGADGAGEGDGRRRKRRRRRRGSRSGEPREAPAEALSPPLASDEGEDGEPARDGEDVVDLDGERGADDGGGRRRRRGRRGGRRRRGGEPHEALEAHEEGSVAVITDDLEGTPEPEVTSAVADLDEPLTHTGDVSASDEAAPEAPAPEPVETAPEASVASVTSTAAEPLPESAAEAAEAKRRRSTVREKVSFSFTGAESADPTPQPEPAPAAPVSVAPEQAAAEPAAESPRRAGWWSRRFGGS
ncbi:Rne/Rng family ribonuclease [Bradyrhizobium sp. LHD-71]|uniref:Rne/Rng family ribonuclease n=1 Tax=Bradyrhizobium sp. LHD-71 TaxID=3072141 RepID=UPI00281069BE|nr:Rne/Rng family ribonuclease [Bradyrhizobium sp. LHD-71]MDQ8729983.1 Rne/Rng family ribonuclease [Bradyrhizobium sp. LHD-71]